MLRLVSERCGPLLALFAAMLPMAASSSTGEQSGLGQLQADIGILRAQLEQLQRQVDSQQQQNCTSANEVEVAPVIAAKPSSVAGSLKFSTDIRYRHDRISADVLDSDRTRDRLRARAAVQATLNPTTRLGLGIISGDDNPISGNQTLGKSASSKNLQLDLAYFDWELKPGLRWRGGKYKNPLHRAGGHALLWDSDLRPEGLSLVYRNNAWQGSIGYEFLESDDKGGAQDKLAYYTTQLKRTFRFDDFSGVLGAGYYHFDTAGKSHGGLGAGFGNSLDSAGNYQFDYRELEFFAEAGSSIMGWPAGVFVDYVKNLDASREDTGYALGLRLGNVGKTGDLHIRYVYQQLESDAVLGSFTESDFGLGGAGNKGHVIKGTYQVNPHTLLALSYYNTRYGAEIAEPEQEADRLLLDLIMKY